MQRLTFDGTIFNKKFSALVPVAIAMLCLAAAPGSAQAALVFSDDLTSASAPGVDGVITNGGTMVNAVTTWDVVNSDNGSVFWQPTQDRWVLLTGGSETSTATVSFDLNVVAGGDYTVTWDTSPNGGTIAQGFTIDLDVTGAATNSTAGIGVGTNTSTTFTALSTGTATFAFTGETNGGISNSADIGLNSVTINAVLPTAPEPSSFVLATLGLVGLLASRRRRRRS